MSKTIIIDSFIGDFGYSQQYVRSMLQEAKPNEKIEVHISSLGGQVNHAIAIHDMFSERGNITAKLTGFIASAATFIGLPCRTRISENSFYLIHKALRWVDEFGMMNEDDIDELIEKLSKEKDENAKITLTLAKRYAERVKEKGKTIQDVLDLMKKDTWLTAEEALEWGFVDEVYKPKPTENIENNFQSITLLNAAGLPIPKRINQNHSLNNNTMKKPLKLQHLNNILNVDELLCDEDGSFLLEEQLNSIESHLESQNQNNALLQTQTAQIEQLNNQVAEMETLNANNAAELNTANMRIAELEAQVAENAQLNQQLTDAQSQNLAHEAAIAELNNTIDQLNQNNASLTEKLSRVPAKKAIVLQATNDPEKTAQKEDWDTINSLPHNQNVE